MTRTIIVLCGALLLASPVLAAPKTGPAAFEAARKYTIGALTVEVGRPTLYNAAATDQPGHFYALNLAVRIDNRLGRSVTLDLNSTVVLDRMDHPLASPSAYRDGKPVQGDPVVKSREQVVLQLFFNVKHPALLDRFDFHWTVVDRGRRLQEITLYKATGLPGPLPAASQAPPVAAQPPGRMGGPPQMHAGGPGPRPPSPVMQMLASYHFFRDLLHGDLLGSSLDPPSGLPWSTVQVTPRDLPMEIDVFGF